MTRKVPVDRLKTEASRYRETLLNGTILSVDPSSGSEQSQPGFAIFRNSRFAESGTVRVTAGVHPSRRYRELLKGIQELKTIHNPDILIIEKLPLMMGQGGVAYRQQSVINLHRASGVIMAGADCERVLEVAPATWRAYLKKIGMENRYIKSDENDACILALTVLHKLDIQVESPSVLFKKGRIS